MTELKSDVKKCPFCEGKAVIRVHGYLRTNFCSYYVQCTKCAAASADYAKREDAAASWNRRSSL